MSREREKKNLHWNKCPECGNWILTGTEPYTHRENCPLLPRPSAQHAARPADALRAAGADAHELAAQIADVIARHEGPYPRFLESQRWHLAKDIVAHFGASAEVVDEVPDRALTPLAGDPPTPYDVAVLNQAIEWNTPAERYAFVLDVARREGYLRAKADAQARFGAPAAEPLREAVLRACDAIEAAPERTAVWVGVLREIVARDATAHDQEAKR